MKTVQRESVRQGIATLDGIEGARPDVDGDRPVSVWRSGESRTVSNATDEMCMLYNRT